MAYQSDSLSASPLDSVWLKSLLGFRNHKLTYSGQTLTHFSSFEHGQNVSIFGEPLYSKAWLA